MEALLKSLNLNQTEWNVLQACRDQVEAETGNEFGYADAVKVATLSKYQLAGYISQLVQKGFLYVHETKQMMLTERAVNIPELNANYFDFF